MDIFFTVIATLSFIAALVISIIFQIENKGSMRAGFLMGASFISIFLVFVYSWNDMLDDRKKEMPEAPFKTEVNVRELELDITASGAKVIDRIGKPLEEGFALVGIERQAEDSSFVFTYSMEGK